MVTETVFVTSTTPPTASPTPSHSKSGLNKKGDAIVAGSVVGGFLLAFGLGAAVFFIWRKKTRKVRVRRVSIGSVERKRDGEGDIALTSSVTAGVIPTPTVASRADLLASLQLPETTPDGIPIVYSNFAALPSSPSPSIRSKLWPHTARKSVDDGSSEAKPAPYQYGVVGAPRNRAMSASGVMSRHSSQSSTGSRPHSMQSSSVHYSQSWGHSPSLLEPPLRPLLHHNFGFGPESASGSGSGSGSGHVTGSGDVPETGSGSGKDPSSSPQNLPGTTAGDIERHYHQPRSISGRTRQRSLPSLHDDAPTRSVAPPFYPPRRPHSIDDPMSPTYGLMPRSFTPLLPIESPQEELDQFLPSNTGDHDSSNLHSKQRTRSADDLPSPLRDAPSGFVPSSPVKRAPSQYKNLGPPSTWRAHLPRNGSARGSATSSTSSSEEGGMQKPNSQEHDNAATNDPSGRKWRVAFSPPEPHGQLILRNA